MLPASGGYIGPLPLKPAYHWMDRPALLMDASTNRMEVPGCDHALTRFTGKEETC